MKKAGPRETDRPFPVGDRGANWNTKHQLSAMESLLGKLPDMAAPVVKRARHLTPRRAKQIKGDQAAELVQAYEAGATLKQLAERFGINPTTVSNILKRHGVKPRWRRLTEEDIDEAVRLYGQGLSQARVADRLGVSADTVRYQLLKRGVKMRDAHGRERS